MLRVLTAGSTLHGLRACAALAAEASGTELSIATDHGHSIHASVRNATARADVVMLPAEMIADLIAKGFARFSATLGTVAIGGAVRAGTRSPPPAIGTMADLRAALVVASAVLLTRAPTGDHLLGVIGHLGLSELIAPKLQRFATSQQLLTELAARAANALGFSPETEIRAGADVTWIGEVPPEIQIKLPYSAASLASTVERDAAARFLDFLATPTARLAFAESGVRFR